MLLNGALFSVPFTILYYATRRYLLVFFSGKSDIYLFNFQFSLIPKINSEQGCGNWRMWTGLRQTSFLPCWDPKEVRAWFQDFLLSFILPPWGFGWVGMSIWENFLVSLYDVPLILHFQFSFNCWKIDILRSNLNWHMQWSYLCFSTCEQQLKISVTFLSETKRGTVVEKCSVVNLFIHWTIQCLILSLFDRFCGGVAHSFTGSAEDRDKLLSFNNLFIGIFILPICQVFHIPWLVVSELVCHTELQLCYFTFLYLSLCSYRCKWLLS